MLKSNILVIQEDPFKSVFGNMNRFQFSQQTVESEPDGIATKRLYSKQLQTFLPSKRGKMILIHCLKCFLRKS